MIHTFIGNNIHERKQAVDKLIADFTRVHGELTIERFDGEESDSQAIFDALSNMSLFAENKLVIVRSFNANKELCEKLEHIIDSISDTTELILVDDKIDKRSATFKLVQKRTDFHEFTDQSVGNIVGWAVGYATNQHAKLSRNDAQFLIDRVGVNQAIVAKEIDKLALYNSNISRSTIELLCEPSPQSTMFQLLDAAFEGNHKKALTIYEEQRAQKVEPHAILGMVAWQLHILALIKSAESAGIQDVAKEAKLSPFVVQKSRSIARRLSLTKLKDLLDRAHKLDIRLKSESVDSDDAMRYFLVAHIATN